MVNLKRKMLFFQLTLSDIQKLFLLLIDQIVLKSTMDTTIQYNKIQQKQIIT